MILQSSPAGATDSSTLYNWGFESGHSSWVFYANSPDSATSTIVGNRCLTGMYCDSIAHWGRQGWSLTSTTLQRNVVPGEIWTFSASILIDSMPGTGDLSFVARDSTGKVISWGLSPATISRTTLGWKQLIATISVPSGCATLTPRISGWGNAYLLVDDVSMTKSKIAPLERAPLTLANDSLRVVFDRISLGIMMRDSISGDTVQTDPLTSISVDSARTFGNDSLLIYAQYAAPGWPLQVGAKLHGGGLLLTLHAKQDNPYLDTLQFPGTFKTRADQRLAMPRGTGITTRMTDTLAPWSYTTARFWEWQVSMGMTGATNGSNGFVVTFDQPWDVQMNWRARNGLLRPFLFHVPSKKSWGHDRSLLISPLRGGGWLEMANRHRRRQEELGRIRTWNQKMATLPRLDLLRGAVDFWVAGSWGRTNEGFIDTLRRLGLRKAVVNWTGGSPAIFDSLNAWGFLSSEYTQYSGAMAGGTKPIDQEIANNGIAMTEDGTTMTSGNTFDANGQPTVWKTISIKRQQQLMRQFVPIEMQDRHRIAQFVDVNLAANGPEDFNPKFPSTRTEDIATRAQMLRYLKDTVGLVVGSEQTRDAAHAVVDYGEGPMSIAFASNSDWASPVAPQSNIDSLSFEPIRRVPLMCLFDHDAFAPTWYTGDGQSKIPLRWDDKDAWGALYGIMPLILPNGRAMWDSLRIRYLRSIHLGSALHERYGFERMTEFTPLTSDWKMQKTGFGNGWNVWANFDTVSRSSQAITLPGKGFLATNGIERVERTTLDGARRSRVLLSDRLFIDPEGTTTTLNGVKTSGSVYIHKLNDTTLELAFLGDQNSIQISPSSLPWKGSSIRAYEQSSNTGLNLSQPSNGWLQIDRVGASPFYVLHGLFGKFAAETAAIRKEPIDLRIERGTGKTKLRWNQNIAGDVEIQVRRINGSLANSTHLTGNVGPNSTSLDSEPGISIIRILTPDGAQTTSFSLMH